LEVVIRHKRQTTRTELEKVLCAEIIFTYVQKYFGYLTAVAWGAIASIGPLDPPLTPNGLSYSERPAAKRHAYAVGGRPSFTANRGGYRKPPSSCAGKQQQLRQPVGEY